MLNAINKPIASLALLTMISGAASAVSFATSLLLANTLGPDSYGQYTYYVLLGSMVTIYASFSTEQTAPVEFARNESLSEVFQLIFNTRVFLIVSCFPVILATYFSGADRALPLALTFGALSCLSLGYFFEIRAKNLQFSLFSLIEKSVFAGGVIILHALDLLSVTAVFVVVLTGLTLSLAVQYLINQEHARSVKRLSIKRILRLLAENLPLVLISVATFSYGGLSRLIVEQKLGTAALGLYTAAWQLILIGTLGQAQVDRLWRTKISMAVTQKKPGVLREQLASYFLAATIPLACFAIALYLLRNWVFGLLYSAEYAAAASLLGPVAFYLVLINFDGLVRILWIANGSRLFYLAVTSGFGILLLAILFMLPEQAPLWLFASTVVLVHGASIFFLASTYAIRNKKLFFGVRRP